MFFFLVFYFHVSCLQDTKHWQWLLLKAIINGSQRSSDRQYTVTRDIPQALVSVQQAIEQDNYAWGGDYIREDLCTYYSCQTSNSVDIVFH